MQIENTRDRQQAARDAVDQDILEPQESVQKKPFVKPELLQHDALPKVTTGLFGSFP